MRRTIKLAARGMHDNQGGPFAALIVKDGRVVAEGHNQVTSANDPTAHAEVVTIRNACRALGHYSLAGCDIYASCEPCPMCLAAIYWARLDRIYYANSRRDAAEIGFDDEFLYREVAMPLEQRAIPTVRLLADEARAVFDAWQAKSDKIRY